MKQIRRGVFETNSSSVHTLTMCSEEEYEKWENGELLYYQRDGKFDTKENIIKNLKTSTWYSGGLRYPDVNWEDDNEEVAEIFSEEGIKTYKDFFEYTDYETFERTYTTPGGEKVVAFGHYGWDG